MPINPNIAMGYQPSAQLESPLNMMSKMAALRDAEQANQMRGMQMQQMQSEAQRQAALRAALRGVDITTPEGLGAARNAYINAGDVKGYHELATGQAALTKAQRESAAAQLKLVSDQVDLGLKFLSGATDQPTYDAAKQAMVQHGLDVSQMPQQFDPAYKQSELLKGVAAKDQLGLHFADLGGTVQPVSKLTGKPVGTALKKTQSPDAAAREARLAKAGVDSQSHPLLAQAILDGRVPLARVNSRTASIFEQVLTNDPEADLNVINLDQVSGAAGARTAGTTESNIRIASGEASKMIGIAQGWSDKVNRSEYPSLNSISNAVAKGTGDKNIMGLNTALNALVNIYARAINPRGVATVSDKEHARELVNTAYSNGQLNTIFDVMQSEMGAALESASEQARHKKPTASAAASKTDHSKKTDAEILAELGVQR